LIEAKIMRIDGNKITIVLEGLAQVAYEVSLHYARHEAHVYTVKWHIANCTPQGLELNSVMLYQQCMSINKYLRASKFLYMCLNHMLKMGHTEDILQLLVNCDLLLNMWKNDILAEQELTTPQNSNLSASGTTQIAPSTSSLGMGFSSVFPVSGGNSSMKKMTSSQMKGLAPTTDLTKEISNKESPTQKTKILAQVSKGRRDSFTIFDEQMQAPTSPAPRIRQIDSSSSTFTSLVTSNLSPKASVRVTSALLSVAYCENRLKFFEAQVYIETKKYQKAAYLLNSILNFCEQNGARPANSKRAGFWSMVSRLFGSSSKASAAPLPANLSETASFMNLTPADINDLYNSAKTVHSALKQLMTMQSQQQDVLRKIALNSRMDQDGDSSTGLNDDSFSQSSRSIGHSPDPSPGRTIPLPDLNKTTKFSSTLFGNRKVEEVKEYKDEVLDITAKMRM